MLKRWLRHRSSRPELSPREQADAWQSVSLLLGYPGPELRDLLPTLSQVADTLPERVAEPLDTFLGHAGSTDWQQLQTQYVDTFDVTRKCCLHLTYFLHGDTRNRGAALIQFKQAYRKAGVVLSDERTELPDHLSVLLEFGATVDPGSAWTLLNHHRVGIELLSQALLRRSSPWVDVVQALRATLPKLNGDDNVALATLIAQGPPTEEVGIDNSPYALDPALDQLRTPPGASGCGPDGGSSDGRAYLGSTIDVGAPR